MFGKSKQYFENVSSRDTSLNFQVSSSCKKKKYDENEEHAIDSEMDTINWPIVGMFQVTVVENQRKNIRKCTVSSHGIS